MLIGAYLGFVIWNFILSYPVASLDYTTYIKNVQENITSRGPATALVFALAMVEKLIGRKAADRITKDTFLN